MPSIRDIINDHAVFPQSEFSAVFAGDPVCSFCLHLISVPDSQDFEFDSQRIRLLPNPCRFTLNDLSFAVSSVDVLFHLKKEEFFKQAEEVDSVSPSGNDTSGSSDSMSNLCRHILQQRRYVQNKHACRTLLTVFLLVKLLSNIPCSSGIIF